MAAVAAAARAELPDVLVGATAEQNIRGLWSKYRPTRHRRESHEFPDRQESEEEEEEEQLFGDGHDRQTPLRRERARRRRRSSARLSDSVEEPRLLMDLIPRPRASRNAKASASAAAAAPGEAQQRRRRQSGLRQLDAQRTVLTPLFPRRHLHQPCTYCGQVPGDDTHQLAHEHLKLQAARDRLAMEEARVEAQERMLAVKQQLLAREKEVEVLMAHAQVSTMQLKELMRRHLAEAAAAVREGQAAVEAEAEAEAEAERAEHELLAMMGEEEDYGSEAAGEEELGVAATRIQAAHRGKAARRERRELGTAATRIQAAHRGRASRSEVEAAKARRRQAAAEAAAAAAEANAAIRIQAIQRGKLCRHELTEQRDAAVRIQSIQRGKLARREAAAESESVREATLRLERLKCEQELERLEHQNEAAAGKVEQLTSTAGGSSQPVCEKKPFIHECDHFTKTGSGQT